MESTVLVDALDDEEPDAELMWLAVEAARRARDIDLSWVGSRHPEATRRACRWPGEHYRFLAGLAALLEPRVIVEVGTATGLASLALHAGAPRGRIVSWDVRPWRSFDDTVLVDDDFASWFEQRLGDLSAPGAFDAARELFTEAELVFVDGPKDGTFEPALHGLLVDVLPASALLVYDDVRLLPMVEFWRALALPKFDATSLAHWTGTGLVRPPISKAPAPVPGAVP